MRKIIVMLLIFCMLSTSLIFANPSQTVKMIMDGKSMDFHLVQLKLSGEKLATDVPAVIHGGRTLVPVHIIRNMGISVEWKEATQEVTIKTKKETIVMEINSPIAIVNGEAKRLPSDVPPKIATYQNSGRTLVPIAFLRELGLEVNWDESSRTVSIENPIVEEPVEEPIENPLASNKVEDINFDFSTDAPKIRVKTGKELKYTELKLSNPDRIVFDFQDSKFDFLNKSKLQSNKTFQLDINDYGIKAIRASQFQTDPFVTRVAVELEEITPYEVFYDSTTGEMVIELEDTTDKALYYRNYDQIFSRLELRAEEVTEYDFSVSDYGQAIHITVAKDSIELEIEDIKINDLLIKEISVGENKDGDKYHIEVQLLDNVGYRNIHPRDSKDFFVEFSFLFNDSDPLIIIDPGHGGKAPGATSPINQLVEKDITLDISQRLNKLLAAEGFRTYMTRVNDTDVSLADRAGVANQLRANLYVSVHANAVINKSEINGIEIHYYPSEKDSNDYRQNKRLAQVFQSEMVRYLGASDRGIFARENLYVLRETNMPAILAEVGFLTNPEEAQKLATSEYRQAVAEALYQSILKYYQK